MLLNTFSFSKTSNEVELLLSCLSHKTDDTKINKIKSLINKGINWDYLLSIASKHRILTLLYWNLNSIDKELISSKHFNFLKDYFFNNSKSALFLTNETLKINDSFEKENIDVYFFKGPITALNIYENLALREFCDIDIFIHKNDLDKTEAILSSLGYKPLYTPQKAYKNTFLNAHYQLAFKNNSDIYVDVHWRITPQYLNKDTYLTNELWSNTEEISLGTKSIKTFSREDLILILCANGAKDLWGELRLVADLANLINNTNLINWERLIKTSQKSGLENILYFGLYLTNSLCQINIPISILEKATSIKAFTKLADKIYSRMFNPFPTLPPITETSLFQLNLLNTFTEKLRYVFCLSTKITQGDFNFIQLPKYLSFLYYFIRPFRLVSKYWRMFFRFRKLAGFLPTPQEVVEQLLEFAQVKSTDILYDLGCGDGRIILTAAKNYGASGVGIDIDKKLIQTATYNSTKEKVENLTTFINSDVRKVDISKATKVALFLPAISVQKLKSKLEKELKNDTIIVSHGDSHFKDWIPSETRVVRTSTGSMHTLYLWQIKTKKGSPELIHK